VSAVEDLVGIRHGETLADLLDAMAVRDLDRALRLLPHVLSQPKITAVSLMLALTTQTLGIAYGRALLDEGEPASRLQSSLFGFLSAAKGAVTARPWGEAVRTWSRAVERWSSSDLEAACDALLRCDMRLKDTRASSDEQIITSLILELCAGGRSTPGQPKR
jgi:DNA polymerase III delta subunit